MQGLDLPDVQIVVQWKVPTNLNTIWQRFGRGARARGTCYARWPERHNLTLQGSYQSKVSRFVRALQRARMIEGRRGEDLLSRAGRAQGQ